MSAPYKRYSATPKSASTQRYTRVISSIAQYAAERLGKVLLGK